MGVGVGSCFEHANSYNTVLSQTPFVHHNIVLHSMTISVYTFLKLRNATFRLLGTKKSPAMQIALLGETGHDRVCVWAISL